MPNVAALTPGVLLVLFLGAVVIAYNVGATIAEWRADERHEELLRDIARNEELACRYERERAFTRASQAVSVWPYRTDRRFELARHLLSLAHAPELGAPDANQPAPNPEATPVVADAPRTVSPGPSTAPVSARPIVPENRDHSLEDYRPELNLMEGFL